MSRHYTNFLSSMCQVFYLTKISDTNQINQYLDIKNYILKTETCRHSVLRM